MLVQLGSRIQHQLRAHTPDAAKALRSTVSTYPHTSYDLEEVLTQLSIGDTAGSSDSTSSLSELKQVAGCRHRHKATSNPLPRPARSVSGPAAGRRGVRH